MPEGKLHVDFASLLHEEGFAPARGIIADLFATYDDVDGNFVEQFQTTGFHARLWELYLFAVLVEAGYSLNRSHPTPDFLAASKNDTFFVEAVTANPTQGGAIPSLPDESAASNGLPSYKQHVERQDYMAIKFGSPLFSKLCRRYWELGHVQGRPLIFAVADFSDGASMISSGTALINYLYGYAHYWRQDENGRLAVMPIAIDEHAFGAKKIPSGFFSSPDAEHVSAVLTNPAATISKFNRMGYEAGHASAARMTRIGTCYKHDPDSAVPDAFEYTVGNGRYKEAWKESLSVYHNPNALHPLAESLLPGVAHHHFEGGQVRSTMPPFHTFGSVTLIATPT